MTDDHQWPSKAELRRIIMRKIAHDLSTVYALEMQLSPRLQEFLQRFDKQREQDG